MAEKNRLLAPPPDELLSVGDIVGRGIRTARRNWQLSLEFFMPPGIAFGLFITALAWALTAFTHLTDLSNLKVLTFPLTLTLITLVSGLAAAWLVSQRTVALARMALVEGTSAETANSFVRTHRWKAFLLYVGSIFGSVVIVTLFILALLQFGRSYNVLIISSIVIIAAFAHLWLYQFWAISLTVLAVEETALSAISQRTFELARVSMVRAFNYVLLLGVAMYFLNIVINIPLLVMMLMDSIANTQTITAPEMPIWVRLFDAVLSTLRVIVLTPCAALCNAYYYNDLRMRCDGWDLVKRLDTLAQMDKATAVPEPKN